MARSLGLPAPERLVAQHHEQVSFARMTGLWDPPETRSSRRQAPTLLPWGDSVLFTGWFDNRAEVAEQLGIDGQDPAAVYGHAVARWGDEADRRIIGAYCAVVDRPAVGEVRLARSALSAPPLHFHSSDHGIAAASVPRALFALGLPAELNEERLAMRLHGVCHDAPGGWYKGIEALPLGIVASLSRHGERRSRPYDPTALPELRLQRDDDYVEAAEELLGEGIARTIAGFSRPGTLLSGGLDSTLVASHLLDQLPTGQRLPSFTWVPEPAAKREDGPHHFADEKPRVEAFAALNPRIEPHFLDLTGRSFDDGMDSLFLLGGTTTAAIGLLYPYDASFAAARSTGCDLMVGAGFGNETFSGEGRQAYTAFLKSGKLRELWRALAARPGDKRPVWRRFLALSLLRTLPYGLWCAVTRMQGALPPSPHLLAGALNPNWPGKARLEAEARRADPAFARPFYRSRSEEVEALHRQMDGDGFDLMQAFQQRHQIAYRDVTRYRPFVEFCWRLPVDQLMRGGESRYLARRMGRGRLPEEVRTETRYGLQHGDWHLRLGRRRDALLAELRCLDQDPKIRRLVDTPRLIRLLEQFPQDASMSREEAMQYQVALPNGIAAARLIRYVSGTNA